MQMIPAAKMRRAQEQTLSSRMYAQKAWEVLNHLSEQPGAIDQLHPLLTQRPVKHTTIVLFTSNRGLAGGYNTNIIKKTASFIKKNDKPVSVLAVGRKGRDTFSRAGKKVIAEFSNIPDRPSLIDVLPIARIALDDFLSGETDEVFLAYTSFVNTIVQNPVVKRLLPLVPDKLEEQAVAGHVTDTKRTLASTYIYEPDPAELLDVILPRFTETQIYQAVLESLASEHSARMVAMRNATDNANELVSDLTLTYNRVRQESITKEMLDIVGGAEAQK